MKKVCQYFILIALLFCSCERYIEDSQISHWNRLAYSLRYSDIDSSLYYAQKAYHLAKSLNDRDGKYEALNNLAYVAYQQMHYDQSLHILDHVYRGSVNQIELLCADVLEMKVAQRVGMGRRFFDSRIRALKRLKRIDEEIDKITENQRNRIEYARTELHIICSTYYFYLGQPEPAIKEIQAIDDDISLPNDTTQWLNYHYMLGSGGLIQGDSIDITLAEFDHLFRVYTLSAANGYTYFEANSLQSLAYMMADSRFVLISQERADAVSYLYGLHAEWGATNDSVFSYALANHALFLFRRYKDLFQTACAYRTLGELYFDDGDYEQSHSCFLHARSLVSEQKKRSNLSVSPWNAAISEKLSLTYSALGDKESSYYYRNIYLDLLDKSRQNREVESRMEELSHELKGIHIRLFVLVCLIGVIVVLAIVLSVRMKHRSAYHSQNISSFRDSEEYTNALKSLRQIVANEQAELDLTNDNILRSQYQIKTFKSENIERRAKVSLVYAIIPYLDRILAEVDRMRKNAFAEKDRLQYVAELSDEIMHINSVLTDWIQMQKGQLKLHITTFPLQSLFDIILHSKQTFEKKGITLNVSQTDISVKADEALTLFMINTLVDNARKFTPEGGEVSIGVSTGDDYVEIDIRDNGIGMSQEDVDILNNNKVYDASLIGESDSRKGFGFGIMNCKGIINKYRKLSSMFSVCDFGVESQKGQGSRFWFRLPKMALSILLASYVCFAQAQDSYALYDSVYNSNVEGRYEDALNFGECAIRSMEEPLDTALLVSLRNEMAISALSLNKWDVYRYNNLECVRLHQLYTQDNTLEAYCLRMERMQSDSVYLYVLMVLSCIVALVLFYFLFLRDRLRNENLYSSILEKFSDVTRRVNDFSGHLLSLPVSSYHMQSESSLMAQLALLRSDMNSLVSGNEYIHNIVDGVFNEISVEDESLYRLNTELQEAQETLDRLRFEENRLYVMNQILDNSLSTIKHETMYYPARIQQMVGFMIQNGSSVDDISELHELVTYYKDVYTLLYSQALRQVEQNCFHGTIISLRSLIDDFFQKLQKQIDRNVLQINLSSEHLDYFVYGDLQLLQTLLNDMVSVNLASATSIRICAYEEDRVIRIQSTFGGIQHSEKELEDLFTPDREHIPYLLVRQIIREHDSYSGHPGLRLYASSAEEGFSVSFTLLKKNI